MNENKQEKTKLGIQGNHFTMSALVLRLALCEIDNGRFEDIVDVLKITNLCSRCGHFNLGIKDKKQQYRCKCIPTCIAATLHHTVISYINWKMGWIRKEEHLSNLD